MAAAAPFVSACYIVKNEEELLGASLASVQPFVDEIVVYDTGSTDRTLQIARDAGARVFEGYWDDDFGAARNRALAHCSGEWVVSVDADEVLVGDERAWRRSLHLARGDSFALEVVSTEYSDGGGEHRAMVARVLRRAQCRWDGALHEAIVGRWSRLPDHDQNPTVFLRHFGYTHVFIKERNKGERNLKLAQIAYDNARARGSKDTANAAINLARSAGLAGEHARALQVFAELDLDELPSGLGVIAAPSVLTSALAQGDLGTARRWIDLLEAWGESRNVLSAMRASVHMASGEWAEAEALLRGLQDDVQRSAATFRADSYTDNLITCVARQGRGREAADLLLEHLPSGRSGISGVSALLLVKETADGIRRLAQSLPTTLEVPFIAQLQNCRADVTKEFFEHLWTMDRRRQAVLAAVSKQWPSLDVEGALRWSLRLREAGRADLCPLRRIATAQAQRDTITRIVCASILVEIGEDDVMPVLESMLSVVPDEEVEELVSKLTRYAPGVAASLVPA